MKALSVHFEDYARECQFTRRLRPDTIRGYREVFRHFANMMPEVITPQELDPEIITLFFQRLDERERNVGKDMKVRGVKDSTIRTYWSKLRSFFAWLRQKGIIAKDPLEGIRPPQAEYSDDRALEPQEIQQIIAAITLHSSQPLLLRRDTAMVYLLLFCGLRKNEFISLQIGDVDLNGKMLTVRGVTSKSKKTRSIPIHSTLAFHLKEYFRERNLRKYKTSSLIVSGVDDTGLSIHGLKHWVKRLNRLSGVKFHLHQFRHSFACGLADKDVNTIKIQKLMGHASIKMTMTYLRSIHSEDLRDDISKLTV